MRRLLNRIATVTAALLGVASVAAAQGGTTISGRVTSDAGAPLPGANVYLVGLNIGTQTGDDGRYTFVVPAARATGQTATLTARVIGYTARSVTVTLTQGAAITQNFTLPVNPLRLGEVVVTGAGTSTTRERLGNVINTVDSSAIRRSAETNVVSALAGTAPGVQVRTATGEPGGSASIRIRGFTTIQGTGQPLFVVDGVPIDNSTDVTTATTGGTVASNRASDINPDDIQSIEILKGAAASAIYGARASAGVILITTKSGRSGQTRYTFRTDNTTDKVIRFMPLQREFGQGIFGNPPNPKCGFTSANCISVSYGPKLGPGTRIYDHAREMFRTGHTSDNFLTVSGGNDRTTFYASGEFMRQIGTIIGANNTDQRTAGRVKGTQLIGDKLQLTGNASYTDRRGAFVQRGSNLSGLLLGGYRTPPDFNNNPYLDPVTGLQRSYRYPHPSANSQTQTRGYDNPLFVANTPGAQAELGRFIGNLTADWNPFSWLNVKDNFGGDSYGDYRLEALPQTASSNPVGQVTRVNANFLQIDNNLLATAKHDFASWFNGTLTLGQNLNSRRYRYQQTVGQGLIVPLPFALQNTSSFTPFETRYLVHVQGYFAQAELGLFDQLYLTGGLRNDGFSTFGASNRRATYPKFTAAWTFTNMLGNQEHRGLLSYGKLRMAYGETGREPGVYSTLTGFYTSADAAFGGGYGDILYPLQSGQPGVITATTRGGGNTLRPERTKELEFGTDLSFFDQKVDLGYTYYTNKSTDVILTLPASTASTGFANVVTNGARIENRGTEISLNARPYTSARLGWDFGVTWSRNNNVVKSLLGAEFVSRAAGSFSGAYGSATVGYPVGVLRGQDFAICGRKLVIDGVDIDAGCGPNSKGALYISAGGLPVVDPTDRVIANPTPRWLGSFRTSLRVGTNLRFSTLIDVRKGGDVWNGTKGALYTFGTHADTRIRGDSVAYGVNYFTKRYPRVAGPGARDKFVVDENWWLDQGGGFGDVAAQFIEDGGFVKLRELGVTYTLDQSWVRSMNLSSIDLRVAGRNLKTWTKYTGLDPEANLGGAAVLVQGIDYFNNPTTRSFLVSVSLNR